MPRGALCRKGKGRGTKQVGMNAHPGAFMLGLYRTAQCRRLWQTEPNLIGLGERGEGEMADVAVVGTVVAVLRSSVGRRHAVGAVEVERLDNDGRRECQQEQPRYQYPYVSTTFHLINRNPILGMHRQR